MPSPRNDLAPMGATDNRRNNQVTVWDRLHAERSGTGGTPFDTAVDQQKPEHHFLSDGTRDLSPKVKLTDKQQRDKWADDLRSARQPTAKKAAAAQASPYAWDDGTTQSATVTQNKKKEKASLPAGVKQAWATQIVEAQEPAAAFHRTSGDYHHKGDVDSGVLGHRNKAKGQQGSPIIGDGTNTTMASFKKSGQGVDGAALAGQQLQWRKDLEASQSGPRFARKFAGAARCEESQRERDTGC